MPGITIQPLSHYYLCMKKNCCEFQAFRTEMRMPFKFHFRFFYLNWIWVDAANRLQNCNANLNILYIKDLQLKGFSECITSVEFNQFSFLWGVVNSIQSHSYELKGSWFFSSEFCTAMAVWQSITLFLESVHYCCTLPNPLPRPNASWGTRALLQMASALMHDSLLPLYQDYYAAAQSTPCFPWLLEAFGKINLYQLCVIQ